MSDDKELRHAVYKIKNPLQPGESMILKVKANKHYIGFTNDDLHLDLTFNVSFMSEDFLPFIGVYDSRRELADNKYRKQYGLSPMVSHYQKMIII